MTTKIYLSEAQAAKRVGLSRERLRQLRNEGRAPEHRACRDGRQRQIILYEPDAVDRWAAQRRKQG